MDCDWCKNDDNYMITELHLRGKVHPKVKICVACGKETPLDIIKPEYTLLNTSITTDPTKYTTR